MLNGFDQVMLGLSVKVVAVDSLALSKHGADRVGQSFGCGQGSRCMLDTTLRPEGLPRVFQIMDGVWTGSARLVCCHDFVPPLVTGP
jgi:hypothetical protein